MGVIERRFQQFGFPFRKDTQILPKEQSTLFICSGMQQVKDRFSHPDQTKYGSLQSCIRTNDLELVGDGSHLTYFEMIGNFSFGGNDYHSSVELWDSIVTDLRIPVSYVTYHPDRLDHKKLWEDRGYTLKPDSSCSWSDGNIGGNCCELFVKDLEIGNLVNPLEHSTDVGFGLERLLQVIEGKTRVDETELFRQDLNPIVADHYRTLQSFRLNGIKPGFSGRDYICRRMVRRILQFPDLISKLPDFSDWLLQEQRLQEQKYSNAKRFWKRNRFKENQFWITTYGLTMEEVQQLRREMQ